MSELYSQAFLILVVGMVTVFGILILIVFAGQMLIRITNYYHHADAAKRIHPKEELFAKKEIVVITAVVSHLTAGQGTIDSIKKLR